MERERAVAVALASVRLEGLDPSDIEPLAHAWALGLVTDAQLDVAADRLAAGKNIDDLIPSDLDR